MKQRRYLKPEEVDFLGLNHNSIQKGETMERHCITNQQYLTVLEFRNSGIIEDFKRNNIF